MQEFLEIGQIVNTFGIKGMVKVKPFTDDITRFDNLKKVYVESNKTKKQYEIEEVKYHKDMVLIKFKGIDKVEDAEQESLVNYLESLKKFYPTLVIGFCDWIHAFWNIGSKKGFKNKTLFDINKPEDFYFAIVCYISGMTDKFAIDIYNEIIGF